MRDANEAHEHGRVWVGADAWIAAVERRQEAECIGAFLLDQQDEHQDEHHEGDV
jgi:hypothetical protein